MGGIITREDQEDKEEEARLFYTNKDPATYKQMLEINLQAQEGHYFGEKEIPFHQTKC